MFIELVPSDLHSYSDCDDGFELKVNNRVEMEFIGKTTKR